ncbi:hypothetical protein PoB_003720500, partial [Plakobranchus ocellatus]
LRTSLMSILTTQFLFLTSCVSPSPLRTSPMSILTTKFLFLTFCVSPSPLLSDTKNASGSGPHKINEPAIMSSPPPVQEQTYLLLNVNETRRVESLVWWTKPVFGYNCSLGPGVRYNKNRLQVLQAGSFYVHSVISFSAVKNPLPNGLESVFLHVYMMLEHVNSRRERKALFIYNKRFTLKKGQEKTFRFRTLVWLDKGVMIRIGATPFSLLDVNLKANKLILNRTAPEIPFPKIL